MNPKRELLVYFIKYEDLVINPLKTLKQLFWYLLGCSNAQISGSLIEDLIQKVWAEGLQQYAYEENKYDIDIEDIEDVKEKCKEILEFMNYQNNSLCGVGSRISLGKSEELEEWKFFKKNIAHSLHVSRKSPYLMSMDEETDSNNFKIFQPTKR